MTSLLIPYQTHTMDATASTSTVESTLPHPPSVNQSNSASSTPSPAHHASLHQTNCLATSDSDTNCEMESVMKSTADENGLNQNATYTSQLDDTQCSGNSDDTVAVEVKAGKDAEDASSEVKGQNLDDTIMEVKGQCDSLMSEEESGVVSKQEGVANGGTAPMANGHLLMMEQHCCNGLNNTSDNRRVLANVLTQHPPSSVVIELKDLTHIENGRLLNSSTEKNHLTTTSALPHSPPLMNGERETSTVLANPSKSHSEPILAKRPQCNNIDNSDSGAKGDNSHETSILLAEAIVENKPHQTQAENSDNGETGSRLPLGVDGLPCSLDPLQKRVRELELKHRREVAELRVSLKEAQLQVAEAIRLRALEQEKGRLEKREGGGGEDDGVREGECGNGSGHSLHSDDMVSYVAIHVHVDWSCIV